MLIHKHTGSKAADVLPLNVVDPTDPRGEVEDIVDALGRADTPFSGREICRDQIDFVGHVFEVFETAPREVVRDDHVASFLDETVDEVAADESGTTRDQHG
jgi:hypothetical protein